MRLIEKLKMNPPKDTIHIIAPFFKPYLNIICLNGEQYYFRKETTSLRDENGNKRFFHPKIGHQMLRDYHSTQDEILYLAVPINADINDLKEGDFLYIGSAKKGGARFWRGKKDKMTRFEKSKSCFHHESMRRGRDGNSIETYLDQYGSICIYTLTSHDVNKIALECKIQLPNGKYPAHQLETKILSEGFRKWKWNARS